jgi:hypothetical protein
MLNEVRKRDLALGLFEYSALDNDGKKRAVDPMYLQHVSRT